MRKALSTLYGISSTSSTCGLWGLALASASQKSASRQNGLDRLMARHYIHPAAKLGALSDPQLTALSASLSELTIENVLRRKLVENIKRLRDIGSYRGRRHAMGMPVRGQRTQNNVSPMLRRFHAVEVTHTDTFGLRPRLPNDSTK